MLMTNGLHVIVQCPTWDSHTTRSSILAMYYVTLHGANIQVSRELGSRSHLSGCIQRVLPAALGQYEHHDDNKALNGG